MSVPHGYLYVNVANEWPTFQRTDIEISPAGALQLAKDATQFRPRGVFRGGPFEVLPEGTPWYRLRVLGGPNPEGTHVQLFTFTAQAGDAPFDPAADNPFADTGWREAPRDALDILILNPPPVSADPDRPPAPPRFLWVGGILRSDGSASPELQQIRVDYGRATWLDFLPPIYGDKRGSRDFLERFLSLEESVLGGLEAAITDLPLLFDPAAAPGSGFSSWLRWLGSWLAFDFQERWSEAQARGFLAEAFELYGKRGTLEGLRRYLKVYAGVEALIEEPGINTVLAPAQAQGAVAGTSATLGRSHLSRGDDFGASLFEDVAHDFCVQVYCAELTRPGSLEDVRTLLDREKPAHTRYCLSVIEPRMRVGVQGRIGIDAIVGGRGPFAQIGIPLDTGRLVAHAEPCQKEART
jgi:phage tail-like protein